MFPFQTGSTFQQTLIVDQSIFCGYDNDLYL